jgi:exonuclease III
MPGPRFSCKFAWFERCNQHAATLIESKHPMALCGDFIVVPTDLDVTARNPKTAPARRRQLGWIDDASFNEQERWAVSLKEALPRMIAGELSRNAKTIATGKEL